MWGRVLGSVQGGTNKCVRQGEKGSGQIITTYEQSELGNFGLCVEIYHTYVPFSKLTLGNAHGCLLVTDYNGHTI